MTSDIIRSNPRLKVISGAGVGLDNIDVQCATACAIPVLHAPSVNAVSTAEHAYFDVVFVASNKTFSRKDARRGFRFSGYDRDE